MIKVKLHPVLTSRLLFVSVGRSLLVVGLVAAIIISFEEVGLRLEFVERAGLPQLLLLPIPAKRLILFELAFIFDHASDLLLDVLFEDRDVVGLDGDFGRVDQLSCLIAATNILQKPASKSFEHCVLALGAFDGRFEILGFDDARLSQAHLGVRTELELQNDVFRLRTERLDRDEGLRILKPSFVSCILRTIYLDD